MKRYLLLALICLSSAVPSQACLQHIDVRLNGEAYNNSHVKHAPIPYGEDLSDPAIRKKYSEQSKKYYAAWLKTHSLDDYNNYGLALVYLGEREKVRDIFIEIESKEPGRYATAANLGTVYELLGENELALTWIKKAVSIDPTSHMNSEWLHVKILEAKIKGDKYITATFLTGVDFGRDSMPVTSLDSTELVKLRDALYYQLKERMTFIKPLDKIVGLLLFQLANVTAFTNEVGSPMMLITRAKEYGYTDPIVEIRKDKFSKIYSYGLRHMNENQSGRTTKPVTPIAKAKTIKKNAVKPKEVPEQSNNLFYWLGGIFFVLIAIPIGVAIVKK